MLEQFPVLYSFSKIQTPAAEGDNSSQSEIEDTGCEETHQAHAQRSHRHTWQRRSICTILL